MKKYAALLLSLCLAAALSLPAAAADITVDGKAVEAQSVTMVPLRAVGEALGFTVNWDGTLPGARVDNGHAHIDVTLGVDRYQLESSDALGLTAPFSLGAAPAMLSPGTIYVPAELFRPLLGNRADAVTIGTDGSVSFSSGSTGTQIPNPLHTHNSVDELSKAVGFTVPSPAAPAGFQVAAYEDIGGTIAEIVWSDDIQALTFRMSRGSSDNSGNYTVYAASGTTTAADTAIQWRGPRDGRASVAVWTKGGFSYSLCASDTLTLTQVCQVAESVL